MSRSGMQSLRYLRFKFCNDEKENQKQLGPGTAASQHFAEQFPKIETGKAQATLVGGAHGRLSSRVSTCLGHADMGTEGRRGSGDQGTKTSQDLSRFNSVLCGHRNYKLPPPPKQK